MKKEDNPFLPLKYLKSNNNKIGPIRDDEDEEDDWENDMPIQYNYDNVKIKKENDNPFLSKKYSSKQKFYPSIEEDIKEDINEDDMLIPYNYPTIEEDIKEENLNEAVNMWENTDYYRDPIIYNRNNINEVDIPIVDNRSADQQRVGISIIHQLQNIIYEMNANLRQYNQRLRRRLIKLTIK
jgi:hypothetical protein